MTSTTYSLYSPFEQFEFFLTHVFCRGFRLTNYDIYAFLVICLVILIFKTNISLFGFKAFVPTKFQVILERLYTFIIDYFIRSEEHTSELQSLMRISYAVFCLKKKKKKN